MRLAVLALVLLALPARAEVPRVVTDIAPVTGIVADIMGDLGQPEQLLPPGASPHDYSLRPSEARQLDEARIVIWIGPDLAPQLSSVIDGLANDATVIALNETPGTPRLLAREEFAFAAEEDHVHLEGHGHGPIDPHTWLDPDSVRIWVEPITEALAAADPDNAQAYVENAAALLRQLDAEDRALLDEVSAATLGEYAVFHDGYHYLEDHFGLTPAGAVAASDAAPPGPRRMAEVRALLAERDVGCLLTEPGVAERMVGTITEGQPMRVVELDPLGSGVEPGPGFYPRMIRHMVTSILDCASADAG